MSAVAVLRALAALALAGALVACAAVPAGELGTAPRGTSSSPGADRASYPIVVWDP